MCLLSLTHVYVLAGNVELQRAYRQRATEEAATALAEQQAAQLAVEMADARAAAVAEQCAQVRRQENGKKTVPEVLAKSYGILHDINPAAAAPGSPAAVAAAAAQGGIRRQGRGTSREQNVEQQQLSCLEIQAKDQLDAVLRQTLQRQKQQQQQQRACTVQAKKKTKKTRVSQSQSAADEVKHIVHLLAGGKHGVCAATCPSIDRPVRTIPVRTPPLCMLPAELGGTSSRRRGTATNRSTLTAIDMNDSRVNDNTRPRKNETKKSKSKGKGKTDDSQSMEPSATSPTASARSKKTKKIRNKNKESENEAMAIAAAAAERWLPVND
jgi:hypothetical protein